MLKSRILKLGVAAVTITSAIALASLTVASTALPALAGTTVHARPAIAGLALPPGVRPARPPRLGVRPRFPHAAVPDDSVACYFDASILSLASHKWVSAELSYSGDTKGMLRARATAIGPWELWNLCYDYTGGYWFIVSVGNSLMVSTEMSYAGDNQFMLRARATAVGPWERYVLACTSSNALKILSLASDEWTSTEMSYTGDNQFMLRARATAVGPWEQYSTDASLC